MAQSTQMTDESLLEPGKRVDRYEVLGLLGRGGLAVVYAARHTTLDTQHALKVLQVPSPSVRQRLVQEGRIQASLSGEHVVRVTDVIAVEGAPALVMELVDGPSLDRVLRAHTLSIAQANALSVGILAGVAEAHRRGLVHRDLKPANVLLSLDAEGPRPRVADFGLAKVLSTDAATSSTRSDALLGTPAYMAPEQVRAARDVDARADVFALGVVLYELFAGARPFDHTDLIELLKATAASRYQPLQELCPALDDARLAVIARALSPEPADRFADAAAMAEAWAAAPAIESPASWPDLTPMRPTLMPTAEAPSNPMGTFDLSASADATPESALCAACGEETPPAAESCPHCGAEPRLAGRFRLIRRLAEGATGTTYLAHDDAGAVVAIKETLLRASDAQKARELLEREARVLRQLDHPKIPAYVDHGLSGSGKSRFFWLAQTYVEGHDLAVELESKRFDEEEVREVARELCGILGYLHALSPPVIHRDLKPGNVMRRPDGSLVLVDFGSVRDVLKDADLGGSTVAGTFGYMAPEQFLGDATAQTDLYGLGVLMVALLSRRDPTTLLGPQRTVEWRGTFECSDPLAHILDQLLEPSPSQRPASAQALLALLDESTALSTSERSAPDPLSVVPSTHSVHPAPYTVAEPLPPDEPEPFHQPPAARKETTELMTTQATGSTGADNWIILASVGFAAIVALGALAAVAAVALQSSASSASLDRTVETVTRAQAKRPSGFVPITRPLPSADAAPWPVLTEEQLASLPETVTCPGTSCIAPFDDVAERAEEPLTWHREELPPAHVLLPHESTATFGPGPDDPGPLITDPAAIPRRLETVAPAFPEDLKEYAVDEVICRIVTFVDDSGQPYEVVTSACPAPYHTPTAVAVRQWRWDVSETGPARILIGVRFRKHTTRQSD